MFQFLYPLSCITAFAFIISCSDPETINTPNIEGLHKEVLSRSFQLPLSTVLYTDSVYTLNSDLLFVGTSLESYLWEGTL